MNLKGTHTEKNLIKAMEGEALACAKYQIYASLLGNTSKDLEMKVNHIAHNEKEHFKVWAKLLLGDTYYKDNENLMQAIEGELYESENMYPEFARIAREEGFDEIADTFENVSKIEGSHAWMFSDFLDRIMLNNRDQRPGSGFVCLNCGYIHLHDEAPEECPVCHHPKQYFSREEHKDLY